MENWNSKRLEPNLMCHVFSLCFIIFIISFPPFYCSIVLYNTILTAVFSFLIHIYRNIFFILTINVSKIFRNCVEYLHECIPSYHPIQSREFSCHYFPYIFLIEKGTFSNITPHICRKFVLMKHFNFRF